MFSATNVTRWGRARESDDTMSNIEEAEERRVWVGIVLARQVSSGLALPKDMVSLPDILHVKMINLCNTGFRKPINDSTNFCRQ